MTEFMEICGGSNIASQEKYRYKIDKRAEHGYVTLLLEEHRKSLLLARNVLRMFILFKSIHNLYISVPQRKCLLKMNRREWADRTHRRKKHRFERFVEDLKILKI